MSCAERVVVRVGVLAHVQRRQVQPERGQGAHAALEAAVRDQTAAVRDERVAHQAQLGEQLARSHVVAALLARPPARQAPARVHELLLDAGELQPVGPHALVPQQQQQLVHPLDVMGVQAHGGLVEDVGHVGERGAEVADHLDALRLAAQQRARGPLEREVAQPDLHERLERLLQRREQRRHRRLADVADPLRQVAGLHRARVRDGDARDRRRPRPVAEPGAVALGAGGEGDHPLHERADVRLQRVDVLGEHRLPDLRDQPLVRQVDAIDLDLGRLLAEQVVELALGELADRLVRVEEAAPPEDAAVPPSML